MANESSNQTEVESVWDYPRPPRLEPALRPNGEGRRIRVVQGGVVIADTTRALRILETSHPPVYYIPPADIALKHMRISESGSSFCEFKGFASYWSIDVNGKLTPDAAWSYAHPSRAYAALQDYLAFYASKVDECSVDGEIVVPQPGDFYGGWITSHVTGPFKGAPGTLGW
jgi:uncharacterized protein (DUF427 family)